MSKFPNLLPPDAPCRVAVLRGASAVKHRLAIMSRDLIASMPWTEVLIFIGLLGLALV
jgi:hypothetical protein